MTSPGPDPEVTLSDVLDIFTDREQTAAPLTAAEIAEDLSCTRRTAHRKLERLADRGDLETKKVGARSRVWWLPKGGAPGTDGQAADHEKFAEFVRAVEDYAIFTLDSEGHVVSWNEGAERIKGYEREEILGEHFSIFYTDEDREEGVPDANLRGAADHGTVEDEGWRIRKDGTEFWADVVITAIHDDDGTLQGFSKVTRDLTELRRAEAERRLQYSVSTSIARAGSLEDGLDGAISEVCDLTEFEYGEAWLPVDDHLERASITAAEAETFDPFIEPSAEIGFAPGEGLVGRVWESGESTWLADASSVSEANFQRTEPAAEVGLNATLCVPVFSEDAIGAVLLFAMTDKREPDARLIEVIEAVAADLGGLVDRLRTQNELKREREFLDRVLEASPAGITVFSADGAMVRSNRRAVEILGISGDDLDSDTVVNRPVFDADGQPISPGERPFARVFETGAPIYDWEGQIQQPDGNRRWISVSAEPIYGEDETIEFAVVTVEDSTRRRAREQQRRRDRDQTAELLETAPLAISIQRADGTVIAANRRAQELLGMSEDELVDEAEKAETWSVYDPDGQPMDPEDFPTAHVRATGEPVHEEIVGIDDPDGDRHWYSVNATPVFDAAGEVARVITASEEITELKEREVELRRRRAELAAELENIFDRVRDAFYAIDEEWRLSYITEQGQSLLDTSRETALGEPVWDVLPDADGRLRERFEAAMASQEAVSFDQFVESQERYLEITAYPSETGLSVYHRDITERIERERELMESRQRYRTLIDQVPNGAVTMFAETADGIRYTVAGGENLKEMGTSGEALEGRLLGEVLPEDLLDQVETPFSAALDGETTEFELEYEGRVHQVRTAPIRNEDGAVFAGMAISYDDTDRVERERDLERYRTIIETVNDGIYTVDTSGRITQVNETYTEMVGYPREELIGMQARTLVDEDVARDAQEMERDLVDDARDSATLEAELEPSSGEPIVAQATFSILPGDDDDYERVAVVRDITGMREREQELAEYQRIVDTIEDGIYVLDEDDRFTRVNDSFVSMTRFDHDELLGLHATSVFGDNYAERGAAAMEQSDDTAGQVTVFEEDIYTADGDAITVESRFQPFDIGGGTGRVGVVRNVTQRKEYERELKRYETLIEESTDVNGIVDREGTLKFVTPSTEYVLGYTPEELIGEDAFDLIHPEDRARTAKELELLADDPGTRRSVEFRMEHADGTWVWLEARGRNLQNDPQIDGLVVYTRDITDRKAYEQLVESRARQQQVVSELGRTALEGQDLDELFETAARRVADTLDNEYCKVLDLDPEADELTLRQGVGWRDGLVGSATVSAVAGDSQASYTLASDQPVVVTDLETESRFSGPDLLTSHDVRSGISTVIGSREEPWGILGTHDTEPREFSAEDVDFVQSIANVLGAAIERRTYREELEELVEELEESNERLEQFAYVASHDLQEPLRMVSSYVQLLERCYADALDDDAQEFIEYAVDGAERMKQMIDGLLEYSRVDTEAEPFEPVDTEAAVDRVLSDLALTIEDTDARVAVGDLPTVQADRNQLEQVFQNLVSNAIKYSGDAPPEIEIGAERRSGEWVFSVADQGIGMDPDNTERVFEIFDRLHPADEYTGTGIGLALCQKIVERHGGEIWVETEPGEGSTFYVSIPAGRESPAPASRTSTRKPDGTDSPGDDQ